MAFASDMYMPSITRREFCAVTLAGAASAASGRAFRPSAMIRVGLLTIPAHSRSTVIQHALDGFALGSAEATRTAALFGARVALFHSDTGHPERPFVADMLPAVGDVDAVCIALPARQATDAHLLCAARRLLCIDLVTPPSNSTGAVSPAGWVAHVVPSARARAEVLLRALATGSPVAWEARWRVLLASSPEVEREVRRLDARLTATGSSALGNSGGLVPDEPADGTAMVILAAAGPEDAARLLVPIGGARAEATVFDLFGATWGIPAHLLPERMVRAEAWLPELERYGAAQLNDRFRARYGAMARMDSAAWGGWFAAKALVDAALRMPRPGATSLRDEVFARRFDGHKGQPLGFTSSGELQQPLYIAGPGADGVMQ